MQGKDGPRFEVDSPSLESCSRLGRIYLDNFYFRSRRIVSRNYFFFIFHPETIGGEIINKFLEFVIDYIHTFESNILYCKSIPTCE